MKRIENPWDINLIKPTHYQALVVRHTNEKLVTVHQHLERLSRNNQVLLKTLVSRYSPEKAQYCAQQSGLQTSLRYHNFLYRAKQLDFLQTRFDMMLAPNLRNRVFIATIGKHFWVIIVSSAIVKTRFDFQQMQIRSALEGFLKRTIPPFKVRICPMEVEVNVLKKTTPVALSPVAQTAMQTIKTMLQMTHSQKQQQMPDDEQANI